MQRQRRDKRTHGTSGEKPTAALFSDAYKLPKSISGKRLQVIALVAEGLKNPEIAVRLGTTDNMVKNYLRRIFDDLGVWSRLELALWYVAHFEKH